MIGKQETVVQRNAAWRAFWIKIRELNARETGVWKEESENDHSELANAADESAGLTLTSNGKGVAKRVH